MISRVYFEEFLSFDKVELEFDKGLIVFTGPSGAGKSILMDSFLSLFAYKEARAKLGEIVIENSPVENETFMITKGDDVIIKATKKDKVRYFLNNQTVSKKNLHDFSQTVVKFLHLKDTSDFDSDRLIQFLDNYLSHYDSAYNQLKTSFENSFLEYKQVEERLAKIKSDEKKIEDLKEFTKFEIDKITAIDPKVDEYEDLNIIKRNLSKKDKIQDAINSASGVFGYNKSISTALELLEVDASFFDEAMNELNNQFEKFNDSLSELEDVDIEYVLDRIEKLASLQKKFGSIAEALEYKEQKIEELESYENISFEKSLLEKNEIELKKQLMEFAFEISAKRVEFSKHLENKINHYLKHLYLSNAKIHLIQKSIDITGIDRVEFELNGVSLDTISSGEFNRLRLALLTSVSEFEIGSNGILFLDEIDANLSGKESSAIAKVLETLSKSYQIFAISHQPQLTASASQHFFVDKINGQSYVKKLNKEQRVDEISRMISGENITEEAKQFAFNLLNENE